jgi:hypothetical protein
MRWLNFAEHELTKRESEAPEKARGNESEEGEAVLEVLLPGSLSEGDTNNSSSCYGRSFYNYRGPNATHTSIPLE